MATSRASLKTSIADRVRYVNQDVRERTPTVPGVPYWFILPFYLLFAVFLAFPVFYTLYLSFFEYQGVGGETLLWLDLGFFQFELTSLSTLEFVGLDNYASILTDSLFHQALYNTVFILLVQVPIMIGLALALAVALNTAFVRFKGVFRTLLALPVSANLVAYSTVFLLLVNEQYGLFNYALVSLGFEPINWLTEPFWARMTIVSAVTWRWTGYNMLILFAGLQNIPEHLYEAAEIDGANRFEKFRYVTVPQLRPVLLFVVVLSTIGTFKLFAEPVVITSGGPGNATLTILQYIYQEAFESFNLGYASALSYVLVGIVTLLSLVQMRIGGESDA